MVSVLEGYQNRTHDGPPGDEIMWRRLERIPVALLELEFGDTEKRRPALEQCLDFDPVPGQDRLPCCIPTASKVRLPHKNKDADCLRRSDAFLRISALGQ